MNELVTYSNSDSIISELFKTLRTNIEFGTKKTHNTIMITSAEVGDGKSFVASNLAVTFAQIGKKILVIDLDLRKGQVDKIFKLYNTDGMSDLIKAQLRDSKIMEKELEKVLRKTEVENLFAITAGTRVNNPAELIMNGNLSLFLNYLRERFDYIFIDVPPIGSVTDPAIIARYVDNAIMVVSMDKTNSKSLKECSKILKKSNVNILGVVVNRVNIKSRNYKYTKYEYKEEIKKKFDFKKIFSV